MHVHMKRDMCIYLYNFVCYIFKAVETDQPFIFHELQKLSAIQASYQKFNATVISTSTSF